MQPLVAAPGVLSTLLDCDHKGAGHSVKEAPHRGDHPVDTGSLRILVSSKPWMKWWSSWLLNFGMNFAKTLKVVEGFLGRPLICDMLRLNLLWVLDGLIAELRRTEQTKSMGRSFMAHWCMHRLFIFEWASVAMHSR